MQPQSKLDVDILNEILNESGKKITSLFRLNRLRNAVTALRQHDVGQWCHAYSSYLLYMGKYDEALALLEDFRQKYPMTEEFAKSYINVSRYHGEYMEWALNNLECIAKRNKIIEEYKQSIEALRCLFLIDDTQHSTKVILQKLNELNISIKDYRQFLTVIDRFINQDYWIDGYGNSTKALDDGILILISCSDWSDDEVKVLNEEFDQYVLDNKGVDFIVATDDIEVLFTNRAVKGLPEHIKLHDDDDEVLEELVLQRMNDAIEPKVRIALNEQ